MLCKICQKDSALHLPDRDKGCSPSDWNYQWSGHWHGPTTNQRQAALPGGLWLPKPEILKIDKRSILRLTSAVRCQRANEMREGGDKFPFPDLGLQFLQIRWIELLKAMDFCNEECTCRHMTKSNEWTWTISHCLIVNCTTIWLTAYLLCPGFGEAHVCQGVQGRQVLSVDLGWGWIFSRWQQCGHIAALQWFWLLVCWVNGLGLELTYWGLGVSCVRDSHDYH